MPAQSLLLAILPQSSVTAANDITFMSRLSIVLCVRAIDLEL